MKPPIIVLRRCPAWNGLAILGEENSTIIFCLPLDLSDGSRNPTFGFDPNSDLCFSIEERTVLMRGKGLK